MTHNDAFDDYRRTILLNEEFIRQFGHNRCPDWEDKWHRDLEEAYASVRPCLESITKPRIFHDLLENLDPFGADNCHHALVLVLNPPERLFGQMGTLRSPEYLELKRGAEDEESVILGSLRPNEPADASASALEGLNESAIDILESMHLRDPRTWKEIAARAGYTYDGVRRYSILLQKAKLIKKLGQRGFVRLISLPNDCDQP